ncbi:MAG: PAS domain S-box protein [Verrucomicrobiota bacterium]
MVTPEFHKLLLDETPDAIIGTTLEGRVIFWNQGAENMFGYPSREAIGAALNDLIVPEAELSEARRSYLQAIETGFSTYESLRCTKGGALVNVESSSKVVRNGQGAVEFILSTKKDVSLLRVLRDARLVEARFGDLLECTPDGMVMINAAGRIVLANSHAGRLFGYQHGELRGQRVEALLPLRFREEYLRHRSDYFSRPQSRAMSTGLDLSGLRKDGSEFPMEISLAPVEMEQGTLVSCAVRDVTERKRIEQTLQERNIELANANQAKDRFLATMSHELRTPLNAIIGFTGTLLMRLPGPLTPDQEKQLQTVKGSARHLLSLINDLLDLAKIEAGKVELALEPVDFGSLLTKIVATLGSEAEQKGLVLEGFLPAPNLTLHTDQRALNQIILNLLHNAIKFTDTGRIRFQLRRWEEAHQAFTQIDIADTGIGIEADQQARLFEAFAQAGSAAKRRQQGTGLGLHLSQKLAGLLGGRITFESEPGKGSTFTLFLPDR